MSKHIELAKKLKALADRGVGGEKINAKKMLRDFMKKHRLSIEDIDGEKKEKHFFKASGRDRILLHQIVKRVNYDLEFYEIPAALVKKWNCEGNNYAWCTVSEYIEIEAMFKIYRKLLREEYKLFYHAFLMANDLLCRPPKLKTEEELSPQEYKDLLRSMAMASNIKKETFRRQLAEKNK